MANVKALGDYPLIYFEALHRALMEQVVVPCESAQDAKNLRSNLYTFRTLLTTWEGEVGDASGVKVSTAYIEEMKAGVMDLALLVDGKSLIIQRKKFFGEDVLRAALEVEDSE